LVATAAPSCIERIAANSMSGGGTAAERKLAPSRKDASFGARAPSHGGNQISVLIIDPP